LIGVSSSKGATLGLTVGLCVETPGDVTTGVEATLEVTPSVFEITYACGD